MLDVLQYRLLRYIAPVAPRYMDGSAYAGKSKLATLLGEELLAQLKGKTVVDFGCGEGHEAIEMAHRGAKCVFGVDILEDGLQRARERAIQAGVADRCHFVTQLAAVADIIVSLDAFEHFSDPAAILRLMYDSLNPGGRVIASFGPTWYHPLGGHLFSVFPWAHLVFSEQALIRWRNDLRTDGATRFTEVEGGLNRMTISGFEKLVAKSSFVLDRIETVPIRALKHFHSNVSREFTTALVRCQLSKPAR